MGFTKKVNTVKVRKFFENYKDAKNIIVIKGCNSKEKAKEEAEKILFSEDFSGGYLHFVRESKDSYVYAIIDCNLSS